MRCAICDGKIIDKKATIKFDSSALGEVQVPDIKHKACLTCGEVLLSPSVGEKVIDYVKKKEVIAIGQLPVSDFVSLNEAAKILGVTKQAFSKNPRIKNGLIYSVIIDGRRYYSKKSIEKFKETGNGRYLIRKRESDRYKKIKAIELLEKTWITEGKPKAWTFFFSKLSDKKPIRSVTSDWKFLEGIGKYARK